MTEPVPSFSPDTLLSERFRIVRFIARGGMGEVYEAEDTTLREHVALKTVRPEIAGSAGALERFMGEVQLARRVTHPNVCRIFDVFQHRSDGEAPADEVAFVTMELLAGETLTERLARSGRLTMAEALPVVRQVVAGLAAAHKAGVIHRDLKTDNVALVPSPGEEGGLRAVVTDFGLARAKAREGDDGSLMGLELIVGTPAYMAPEQLEGHQVTAASDIYSLGVVMYEMVTGRLPFPGETVAAAARRLREKPASPTERALDLDPRWEAVILRCLERDPIDRFASVADVVKALAGEAVAPGRRALVERRAQAMRKRRLAALAASLAVLGLAGFGWHVFSHRRPSRLPMALHPRRSIAVLGFKNLSKRPEAAWLSTALSEMLTAELAAGEKLRTIPGETVARTKADLALPETDMLAKDTLARIRSNLGSDLVVLGSYFAAGAEGGGKVRLDLHLQDTLAGEMVASVTDAGTETDLAALVSRAGSRLRDKLGVGGLSAAESGGVRAALPSNPEAARLQAEGLAKLRSFDALAARDVLQKAVAADPGSPLAHSALGAAWSALGYDVRARGEAERAFALSPELPREERLVVEGRYRETIKQWDKAIEIYRALWGFFPDSVDYGLRLAEAQTSGGKARDALATVEALRKLSRPVSEDPRVDLAEARTAAELSQYGKCQAAAARAAEKGAALGARLLVAQARFQESRALWQLGELKKASAASELAKQVFTEVGDRAGVAGTLNLLANVIADQGELAQARTTYEEALAIAREVGNKDVMQRVANNIAELLHVQGDLTGAKRTYEESVAICREIGDRGGVADSMDSLAGLLRELGDLAEAKRLSRESLAVSREVGDRSGVAYRLQSIAEVLRLEGDLAGAKRTSEEALAIRREIGHKLGAAESLQSLGTAALTQGDLAAARKRYEETLAIRTGLGDKGGAAETRLALAVLSIEEGRAAEAEPLAIEAAEEFQKEKRLDDEASAHAVLARSLVERGKPAEAREAMARAQTLAGKSERFEVRLLVTITTARGRVASGDPALAVKRLETALLEATKAGFVGLQLEARLALGEIEMKSGNATAGRARLLALEKDASAKGFGLIARKARKAAS